MADCWEWTAELADGSRVRERDGGGFGQINRDECVAIELRPRRWSWGRKVVRVEVAPAAGQWVVFFRRRRLVLRLSGQATETGTLTVAGYQSPSGSYYALATDDGQVRYDRELPD